MKKTYQQPATTVEKLEIQQMICVSGNPPAITIDSSGEVEAGEVGSRGSGFFDDDDY